ncbi:hypothetical protein DNTS_008873 [Danionella cerebrum]|uniref:Uncharacterized protein n=1 Tax=Danionella cerebrum TaxID=2873325 RepID=A0A553Q5V9_9TELE|nr:hypothetical protein DNTS_008873 [Danionella translucida]
MSRFRRYKYATSLPTWSPFVPRPPPPRSPSSKVNDCHESSRGHTVKAPIPRHVPTGFGGHLQPIPGILSRKVEKEHLFTENQQQLSSRQRLPPLLKPLAAKEEDVRRRIQETFNSNCSHQSAEVMVGNVVLAGSVLQLEIFSPNSVNTFPEFITEGSWRAHAIEEEYLSNHHLSLEIPASTYLLILDIFGESVAWSEQPKQKIHLLNLEGTWTLMGSSNSDKDKPDALDFHTALDRKSAPWECAIQTSLKSTGCWMWVPLMLSGPFRW